MLQASLHQAPLVKYVATDVSAAFGPALQTTVGMSEFDFKVNGIRDSGIWKMSVSVPV
jgi:hypothetical protein